MNARTQPLALEPLEDRTLMSTCTVTNLLDVGRGGLSIGSGQISGDLRFCINRSNASPGEDLIIFAVDGVINLNRALPGLTDDLIIAGPGAANLTVRRAGPADYRIFTVPSSVAVQIYGLTIADGRSTFGGGIRNDGTLTIADSVVTGNLNPKPTYFYGVGGGGGIYNNGTLNLFSSTISGNFARSTFGGNGGGIYNEASGVAVIGNSNIVNNTADGTFAYYTGVGGGISNLGSLTIFSSNISNNLAHGHEVSNGNAHSEGGGIFNKGDLTVDSSTIASNNANTTGWCNPSWGAGGYGAGISNHGTAIIVNSTISTNDIINTAQCDFSATYGGGIYNRAGATLTARHTTVAGNSATGGESWFGPDEIAGGGLYADGTVHLHNTVVATNSAEDTPPSSDLSGVLTSSGYNLIGVSGGGSGYAPTDILDVDPMLGPLADIGGPKLTYALLPSSPAIDAGDNTDAPEFDQRGPGFPRIVNGTIDIGAFEAQATGAPSVPDVSAYWITADSDDE